MTGQGGGRTGIRNGDSSVAFGVTMLQACVVVQ